MIIKPENHEEYDWKEFKLLLESFEKNGFKIKISKYDTWSWEIQVAKSQDGK